MKIEDIRNEAWKIHKSKPNFETHDTEGINTLVDIAINKTLSEVRLAFKVISDITPTHAPCLISNFEEWMNNLHDVNVLEGER